MTEHTQTPWRVKMYDQGEIGVRQDCGLGFAICNLVQQDMDAGQPETTANAERIITCVNRCEGLTNKELAKHNLAAVPELIGAVKDLMIGIDDFDADGHSEKTWCSCGSI